MKFTTTRRVFAALTSVATLILASPMVQSAKYDVKDFGDKVPTPGQLVESLKPDAQIPAIRTRGLKPVESAVTPSKPRAASLRIRFAFGSYELTEQAKQTLRSVAEALSASGLRESSFLIEGHSDSVGDDDYNLRLSEQRARAVKEHLVNVLGVEARRLQTVGRGKTDPLDSTNPRSAINRRVQIVNLGSN